MSSLAVAPSQYCMHRTHMLSLSRDSPDSWYSRYSIRAHQPPYIRDGSSLSLKSTPLHQAVAWGRQIRWAVPLYDPSLLSNRRNLTVPRFESWEPICNCRYNLTSFCDSIQEVIFCWASCLLSLCDMWSGSAFIQRATLYICFPLTSPSCCFFIPPLFSCLYTFR